MAEQTITGEENDANNDENAADRPENHSETVQKYRVGTLDAAMYLMEFDEKDAAIEYFEAIAEQRGYDPASKTPAREDIHAVADKPDSDRPFAVYEREVEEVHWGEMDTPSFRHEADARDFYDGYNEFDTIRKIRNSTGGDTVEIAERLAREGYTSTEELESVLEEARRWSSLDEALRFVEMPDEQREAEVKAELLERAAEMDYDDLSRLLRTARSRQED